MTTLLLLWLLALQQAPKPAAEATSLLGTPLVPAAQSPDARRVLEGNLEKARAAYERNPNDADALIWLGRRTAYLGRYREAIAIFTEGIRKHPKDARMYRHRGHRYITVREFERAIDDLARGAQLISGHPDQIEPDGQPNERNIPTSTLNSNIYYHLALAKYLKGDFSGALTSWRYCERFSKNPDMLVATSHWLYMTLRRLNRRTEADRVLESITPGMDIIENGSYYRLLLMYKGLESPHTLLERSREGVEGVTIAYGVANWHWYNGRRDEAVALFRTIVDRHGAEWPAFGYVAAEAELARGPG